MKNNGDQGINVPSTVCRNRPRQYLRIVHASSQSLQTRIGIDSALCDRVHLKPTLIARHCHSIRARRGIGLAARQGIEAEMVPSFASLETTTGRPVEIQIRDAVKVRLWLMRKGRMSRKTGVGELRCSRSTSIGRGAGLRPCIGRAEGPLSVNAERASPTGGRRG